MCTAGYVHRPPFVFFMTSCRIRPDRASPSASALLPCQRQALTCRHATSVSAISSWSPMLPYDGTHRSFFCHSPAHAVACPAPPPPDKAAQLRSCSSTVATSRPSVALARPCGELPPAGLRPGSLIPLLSRPFVKGIEPNSPQHLRLPLSRQRRGPADRPEQKFFQGWMGARGKAGTVFTKNVPAFPRQTRSAPTFRHVPSLFFPPSLAGDQPMKRRKKGGMSRPCPASDPSLPPSGDGRDITTKKPFTAPQGSGPARPVR